MSYLVANDLFSLLSNSQLLQLTDDAKTGLVQNAVITKAIEEAESEVNGYVGVRYQVPVKPVVPDLVEKLSKDITIYRLYVRRQKVPEEIKKLYDDAIETLKAIAAGEIVLDGILPVAGQSGKGEAFGPERVFSRDKLGGF